jgi:hypothetical protein
MSRNSGILMGREAGAATVRSLTGNPNFGALAVGEAFQLRFRELGFDR